MKYNIIFSKKLNYNILLEVEDVTSHVKLLVKKMLIVTSAFLFVFHTSPKLGTIIKKKTVKYDF